MRCLCFVLQLLLLQQCKPFRRPLTTTRSVTTASLAKAAAGSDTASTPEANIIRELGSYEKLLSRKTPGLSTVSLSHSSVFLFPSARLDHGILMGAISKVVQVHPLLRCGIRAMHASLYFVDYKRSADDLAVTAYSNVTTSDEDFEGEWRDAYTRGLNAAAFPEEGPLWKLTHVVSPSESAFVFSMNHGIDDQASVNIIMEDILRFYSSEARVVPKAFPPPIERAVAGDATLTIQTLMWAAFQSLNSLLLPSMLPDSVARIKGPSRAAMAQPEVRKTFCEFVVLSKDETSQLVALCKANKLTVTNLLSALMLISTSNLIQDVAVGAQRRSLNLRFLLSVGLRGFGSNGKAEEVKKMDFTDKTVACASGAVDFVVPVFGSIVSKYCDAPGVISRADLEGLLRLGRSCSRRSDEIINQWRLVPESVRLFDLGFKLVDILQAVEIEARNPASLGRGYSCGVSNMGVVSLDGSSSQNVAAPVAGFYATSHGRNGVLAQLSCMTINGRLNGCLQFTDPIVSGVKAALFREKFEELLRRLLTISKM